MLHRGFSFHPYKLVSKLISSLSWSRQAHQRVVGRKLGFLCQQSKWSCSWPGSITIPLLTYSLFTLWSKYSLFFSLKKLLWSYTPLLLHHIYFLTLSPSAHKEKEDSRSQCEQPLCTATHSLHFSALALHVKHLT